MSPQATASNSVTPEVGGTAVSGIDGAWIVMVLRREVGTWTAARLLGSALQRLNRIAAREQNAERRAHILLGFHLDGGVQQLAQPLHDGQTDALACRLHAHG